MTETTEKKEIVPTLRKMAVGECEVFPLSQARSIGSTIYGANLVWNVRTDTNGPRKPISKRKR